MPGAGGPRRVFRARPHRHGSGESAGHRGALAAVRRGVPGQERPAAAVPRHPVRRPRPRGVASRARRAEAHLPRLELWHLPRRGVRVAVPTERARDGARRRREPSPPAPDRGRTAGHGVRARPPRLRIGVRTRLRILGIARFDDRPGADQGCRGSPAGERAVSSPAVRRSPASSPTSTSLPKIAT